MIILWPANIILNTTLHLTDMQWIYRYPSKSVSKNINQIFVQAFSANSSFFSLIIHLYHSNFAVFRRISPWSRPNIAWFSLYGQNIIHSVLSSSAAFMSSPIQFYLIIDYATSVSFKIHFQKVRCRKSSHKIEKTIILERNWNIRITGEFFSLKYIYI